VWKIVSLQKTCVREVAVLGMRVYEGLACDVVVPLCGGTCDKMPSCGLHRFHERCHRRHCIETCRIVVIKLCQCGKMKIEVKTLFFPAF
jgi:NF-X1-type zinc finger protein NFXL1